MAQERGAPVADPVYTETAYHFDSGHLVSANRATGTKAQSKPIDINDSTKLEEVCAQIPEGALKFLPGKSESVEVTPCGLILVSRSDKITQVNLNKSYASGIHCWEFYCPLSCYGITFGLRNRGGRREETFEFSASTPRTITFKLDMNQKLWKSWINNTLHTRKPVRELNQGEWSPFVRIKEKGNIVILNPFAKDPQHQVTLFNPLRNISELAPVEPYKEIKILDEKKVEKKETGPFVVNTLNKDTIALISEKSIKLIYRNAQTQKFDANESLPSVFKTSQEQLRIELYFSSSEMNLLIEFAKFVDVTPFESIVKEGEGYTANLTVSQWTKVLSHLFSVCDKIWNSVNQTKLGNLEKAEIISKLPSEEWLLGVYRILASKAEQLKPYVKGLDQSEVSQFDRASRWGLSYLFFKDSHPERLVNVSLSIYQNSLPAIPMNPFKNILSSEHYFLVELVGKDKNQVMVELYNYELVPFKVLSMNLAKGFKKVDEIKKYKDIIENLKKSGDTQPSIYKILSNCLTEAKKAKPLPPKPLALKAPSKPLIPSPQKKSKQKEPFVDTKLLDAMRQMGFPIEKCKKALIETKNVSVEVALEYFLSMPQDPEPVKTKPVTLKEWSCQVCTLINKKGTECEACQTPAPSQLLLKAQTQSLEQIPEEPQKKEIEPEIQQQRMSRDIQQPLLAFAFAQTNIPTAPILIVGCFDKTTRIRLVGQNPMYYSKFHIKTEKGFIDYSDFSIHDNPDTIDQRPIRYLENIFVGAERAPTSSFGWIVLEDEDLQVDKAVREVKLQKNGDGFVVALKGPGIDALYQISIRKESMYNEFAKAITYTLVNELPPAAEQPNPHPQLRPITVNSNSVPADAKGNIFFQCTFSQVAERNFLEPSRALAQGCIKQSEFLSESCNGYLPLVVEEAPPGCNMNIPVCSILYPSGTFHAQYPYRIVLRHLHGKRLLVDSAVIQRIGSSSNVKSIKSGYFYLLNDLSKQPTRKHYFEFNSEKKKIQVDISESHPYQYLVIEPVFQVDSAAESPFEIGFVGALGRAVEELQNTQRGELEAIRDKVKFQICGYKGTDKYPIREYQVSESIVHERLELDFFSAEALKARIQQYFQSNVPVDIRLSIKPKFSENLDRIAIESIESPGVWKLVNTVSRVERDHKVVKDSNSEAKEIGSEEIKSLAADCLAGKAEATDQLPRILKSNANAWKLFLNEVDVNRFIDDVLLVCPKKSYSSAETIVDNLLKQEEFKDKININSYFDLARLQKANQTSSGLQLLAKLIQHLNVDPKQASHLIDQLLEKASAHKKPQYRTLRKSGNVSLSLQKQLFSDYYFNLVKNQQPGTSGLFQANKFVSKFVMFRNRFFRKYIIDLTNNVRISNLLFSFDKSDSKTKMIIKVYRVGQHSNNKQLVFQHYYQQSVWIQLTKNAYSTDMNKLFKNPIQSGLNCLGVSGLDFSSRYLIVEVSFTIIPNIGDQRELENLPSGEIIPEVFGTYNGEAEPLFQEYFGVKSEELVFFNSIKFHEMSRFAKYSFAKDSMECFYYDTEDNMANKDEHKSKAKAEFDQNAVNELVQKHFSKDCLDYEYTLLSLLTYSLSKKPSQTISEDTALKLYDVLVRNEKGPVVDRSISLLRKLIRSNPSLYLKLLKQPHTADTFTVFKDVPVEEEHIKSELLAGPCKDLIRNTIVLARSNNILDKDLIELVLQEAMKSGLEEPAIPLLKNYKVNTRLASRLIKGLCTQNPEQALTLIKNLRNSCELLALASDCVEDDYKTFEVIIQEIVQSHGGPDSKSEEFKTAYKQLVEKILELASRRDSERDLKILMKLAKGIGIGAQNSERFIELFMRSKSRNKLQSQFLGLQVLRSPECTSTLLRFVLLMMQELISDSNKLPTLQCLLQNSLIFLTGDSNQDFDPSVSRFKSAKPQLRSQLLSTLCGFVNNRLMVGGLNNVKLASTRTHQYIVFANYLASMVCSSIEEEAEALREEHLASLLSWFLLNNVGTKEIHGQKSYSLVRFAKLSNSIQNIIESQVKKSDPSNKTAKFLLATAFAKFKEIDSLLPNLTEKYTRSSLQKNILRGFSTLTFGLLRNPEISSYFNCELGGFEYTIDSICSATSGQPQSQPSNPQKQNSKSFTVVGEAATPKDWLINKNGDKSAYVYNVIYSHDTSRSSELLLTNEKGILLTKLIIGMIATDTAEKNNVLPRTIELYGGNDKDDLRYLGRVEQIPDDYYVNFSTRVFGINLAAPHNNYHDLPAFINELNGNESIRFLKLVFRCPDILSVCDVLDVPQKSNKSLFSSISFMSLTGCLSSDSENVTRDISNSLQLLKMLSSKSHSDVVEQMLSKPALVQKLKVSLKRICDVATESECERLFNNFIGVVSEKNAELGNCIIGKYLTHSNPAPHSQIVSQIVLSNTSELSGRVAQLHNFIMSSLKESKRSVIPFIKKEIEILHLVALDKSKKHGGYHGSKIVLETTSEEINNVVEMAVKSWSQFDQVLMEFVVALTLLQEPFAMKEAGILESVMAYVWAEERRLACLKVTAALLVGSAEATKIFLQKSGLQTTEDIVYHLATAEQSKDSHLELTKYLYFLADISNNRTLKESINKSEFNLKVFEKMSVSDKISQMNSKGLRKALVTFIVNSSVNTASEKRLALILRDSLEKLGTKQTNDNLMELEVFLPILNSYGSLPVCLQAYDQTDKRFIANPNQILLKTDDSESCEIKDFPSAWGSASGSAPKPPPPAAKPASHLLSKPMQDRLAQLIPKQVEMQLAYSQTQDSSHTAFQTIKNKLLGNSFLILIQAKKQTDNRTVVIGVNYSAEAGYPKGKDTNITWMRWNPECWISYFEEGGQMVHWKEASKGPFIEVDTTPFETFEVGWTEEGGDIAILLDDDEKLTLSLRQGENSFIDFTKTPENEQKVNLQAPSRLTFVKAEYWLVKPVEKAAKQPQKAQNSSLLSKQLLGSMTDTLLFSKKYTCQQSSVQLLRCYPVYMLPSQLKIKQIKRMISILNVHLTQSAIESLEFYTDGMGSRCQDQSTLEQILASRPNSNNIIVDLQYNAEDLFNDDTVKTVTAKGVVKEQTAPVEFLPKKGLFKAFEAVQGVEKLIEVVSTRIAGWKNQDRAKKWMQYIQELKSFSSFPYFFSMYMKEKQTVDMLLNLLVGLPDREDVKKWQDMESKSIKQLYKIVAEVLLLDRSLEFRQYSITNKFITTVLDRLHLLSKEEKRQYVKDFKEKEEGGPSPTKADDDEVTKKRQKKKGVGYGNDSSSNPKWVAQDTTESKKESFEQIQNILSILENFLNVRDWKIPESLVEQVKCSSLLPLVQSTLRAGTLLEISKDPATFKSVLALITIMTKNRALIPCLMDLPKNYQPSQSQSIFSLLKSLENTSKIFISCLGQNSASTSEANKVSEAIARQVLEVFKIVEEAVEDYNESNDDNKIGNILDLPLDKKYRELLKDLRFDYVSMRDSNGKMKHHYNSYGSQTHVSNPNKMIRLAQQLADLSTSLPMEHTNAIFVRCDKDRVDFMQALVMGANGTPYGHGAYMFDVYFEDNYPNCPPKVNLMTTGSGKVRFNPNLYNCGKVCLSLLGTWRGNATENWDPKVSTLLQVLLSLQSIIMSEDVFFNEPGFEHEQGTDEGEKKNEGYSNIVRYCNIKFAMIENIKNPPAGFETVIRRHFYLKKDEILHQTEKWLKYAQKREATYVSLVNDHNSSWSAEFKKSKGRYLEMLTAAVTQLKQQLNKLPPPSLADIAVKKSPQKKKKELKQAVDAQNMDLNDIDVSYDSNLVQKELNIDDEKVRDRWSRYIGAMGIDAVSKQSKASVFILGLGPFALEVAKNIVLSGCKRLTFHDTAEVSVVDLSGGFFYSESDVGKKRVPAILHKIQQLNQYVKVDALSEFELAKLKGYDVVLVTETELQRQVEIDKFCREAGIKFLSADCMGPYSRLFNDFGPKFEVLDKNGEEPTEVMIKNISTGEKGVVTLLDGAKHPYEDGEVVIIKGVEGMDIIDKDSPIIQGTDQLKSINGTLHKIETINSNSFRIGGTQAFTPYIRNGTAKNLKLPIVLQFPSLQEVSEAPINKIPIDDNLCTYDFTKMETSRYLHACFLAYYEFAKTEKRVPKVWSLEDAEVFIKYFAKFWTEELTEAILRFAKAFSMVCQGSLPPLCAFWGGFVSQQIIKAITQKYKPTKSLFYAECSELIQDLPEDVKAWPEAVKKINTQISDKPNRARGFQIIVGRDVLTKIESSRLFMIGAGAIGCELLKNFAMINLSVAEKGLIVLTDPDHIETSNLNRQFLFREKHIRKPKSSTAAASVLQMNPLLKGHIAARLDKVHDGTKDIYDNKFFQSLTIVANALDNVQARRYVDQRCVENKVPLLESGTLGPKGHVQVILPYLTESYGSKNDPAEEGEIPHCTLKMFPEETLHCVEWARDKFGHKFSLRPKALVKVTEDKYKPDNSEIKTLNECVKLLRKKPRTFDDCICVAVKKFYKYFRNDVMQLMYTYPLDAKTKNGEPFWKLPKRPPTAIPEFNPEDILHCTFVASYAVLIAKIFNIPFPKNFRTDKERLEIGKLASKIKIEPFVPSDKKAKSIINQSEKKKEEQEEQKQEEETITEDENSLMKKIHELHSKDEAISPEEFEKDDDANGHIDFIYSMANLRSRNYKLDPMDWVTTKIKAGRIVPALSTTTTAIAGIQTLELVKYIKGLKLDRMRNAFLNLAVPVLQLSEPGEVEKVKLTPELSVTIWDRWEVKCSETETLKDLFKKLEATYKLKPNDVFQDSTPVYLSAQMDIPGKEKQKEELLGCKLTDLFEKQENYVDLIVTLTQLTDKKILTGVPLVRVVF